MKDRKLTEMERRFCEHFTAVGTPTFRDGNRAAAAVGYGQPHNASWRLLKRASVMAMIAAMMPEPSPVAPVDDDSDSADNDFLPSTARQRAMMQRELDKAIQANDHRAAAAWSDQLNKALGMYRDGGDDDPAKVRQYTAMEIAEAQAYARWRLLGGPDPVMPNPPAQDAPGTIISSPAGTSTPPQTGRVGAATTTLKGISK